MYLKIIFFNIVLDIDSFFKRVIWLKLENSFTLLKLHLNICSCHFFPNITSFWSTCYIFVSLLTAWPYRSHYCLEYLSPNILQLYYGLLEYLVSNSNREGFTFYVAWWNDGYIEYVVVLVLYTHWSPVFVIMYPCYMNNHEENVLSVKR